LSEFFDEAEPITECQSALPANSMTAPQVNSMPLPIQMRQNVAV